MQETKREQTPGAIARRQYFDPFSGFGGDLFRMSPFALLRMMTEQMDKAFTGTGAEPEVSNKETWMPALEVKEHDGQLTISAELPGIDPKDVKIEVIEDTLIIEGERKREHEEEKAGYHRTERSYGRFYRAIQLPEGVKTEEAKAEFKNGVLEVKLPVPETKPARKQIPIQAGAPKTIETPVSAAKK